ncbi:MAG: hypothetical protein COA65_02320 [Rhodospirillaceae bacterium]|nr:MAG: hypothetical protein COA65_02320 [Rhodospirillaceae bacterium]
MTIELTREELFKQVWERPMTKVAADHGISDVALKKICDKHRIPVPGRGYWAKKAAGKKVERAYFRAVTDPAINRITIHGSSAEHLPETVKEAKQAAEKRERRPENKVEVVPASEDRHPKVMKTGKKLEKTKPQQKGLVITSGPDFFDLEIGTKSVVRVIAFLNALATAAEARGYHIVKGDKALVFVVEDEPLDIKITEKTTRSKHEPTETELAAMARWKRRQERRHQSWQYVEWAPPPTPPEWDYTPNGRLQVALNEGCYGYNGLRRTFGDGKTQRIETLINGILEAFATWSAAIKAKRVEDERQKREWEEAERQREEQRQRDALDKKRVEALSNDLKRLHQGRQVLDYVAAVREKLEAGQSEDPDAVQKWIEWANDYADRLDPLRKDFPKLLQFEDFNAWELRH